MNIAYFADAVYFLRLKQNAIQFEQVYLELDFNKNNMHLDLLTTNSEYGLGTLWGYYGNSNSNNNSFIYDKFVYLTHFW